MPVFSPRVGDAATAGESVRTAGDSICASPACRTLLRLPPRLVLSLYAAACIDAIRCMRPNLQASFVIGRLHGVRSLAEAQPLG